MIRIIISVIVLVHGLIHVMGFVKAFGLAEMNQLKLTISKPLGLVWLFAALLCMLVGIFVLLNKQWVWIPAIIAVAASQVLIILSWQDAKFGTIPNLIIMIFAIFIFSAWNFNTQIDKELDSILLQAKGGDRKIVNEQMLAPLPSSVQKWLKQSGVVGREEIQTAHFKQKGQMKLQPDQKGWAPAKVDQYVTTISPGFLWKVNMKMYSVLDIAGRDKFQQGNAAMTIKIGSLFPVVNTTNNEKTNQSTMQRFLMELPWYPSAALSPYITWEEVDENTAIATMNYQGVEGSATFYFNQAGEFLKVSAMRYKDSDEKAKLVECIGEAKAYRVVDGIRIPTKMNVTWILDDGPFTWYKLEILKAEYN